MLDKFAELTPTTIIALVALAVVGIVLAFAATRVKWNARMLAYAALCIALSFVLSYIRLFRMPQGGSVTAASMLPLMLFSYMFGPLPGFIAGAVYGLLQFLQDAYFVHPLQLLLDYPLAFAFLGLAGIFRGARFPGKLQYLRLPLGATLAGFMRLVMHVVSGAVFFAEYAPAGTNVWIYSIGYNGSFVAVDTLICLVILCIPAVQSLAQRNAARLGGSAA